MGITNLGISFLPTFLSLAEEREFMNRHHNIPTIITHLYLERYNELDIFKAAYFIYFTEYLSLCSEIRFMSKTSKFYSFFFVKT